MSNNLHFACHECGARDMTLIERGPEWEEDHWAFITLCGQCAMCGTKHTFTVRREIERGSHE